MSPTLFSSQPMILRSACTHFTRKSASSTPRRVNPRYIQELVISKSSHMIDFSTIHECLRMKIWSHDSNGILFRSCLKPLILLPSITASLLTARMSLFACVVSFYQWTWVWTWTCRAISLRSPTYRSQDSALFHETFRNGGFWIWPDLTCRDSGSLVCMHVM